MLIIISNRTYTEYNAEHLKIIQNVVQSDHSSIIYKNHIKFNNLSKF